MGVNFVDAFSDWECLRLRLEFALLRSVMRIALKRTAGAEQALDQAVTPAVPGFLIFSWARMATVATKATAAGGYR
jgi:hypothetical protein